MTRLALSESVSGQPVQVAATASPGTLIHQVPANRRDKVRLLVTNRSGGAVTLTVELGGTNAAQRFEFQLAANDSLQIEPPFVLEGGANGQDIRAFSTSQNDVSIVGTVERD